MIPDEPHNREAEEALLGSVLRSPEYFRECNAILAGADDFYIHRNRWIWEAVAKLDDAGEPIDSLTVSEQLYKDGKLNEAGGGAYLAELAGSVPMSANATTYAAMVAEMAGKRRMLSFATYTVNMARDGGKSFLDALEAARRALDGIPVRRITQNDIMDQLSALYDEVDARRKAPKSIWGVPIGITRIDEETGGMQRGELTILAGRPKIGKSLLAGQVAYYGSAQGFSCGIYSLEMRAKQILRRQIAALSGISTNAMRSGFLSEDEWGRFVSASAELSRLPLFIVDDSALTLEQIRADIYTRSKKRKVDMAIVDYIGLINDPEPDELIRENNITKGLKRMADQEDVAIIAIHSMNKEGLKQAVPTLSSVSGTVKNVYNADNVVFFLDHRPEKGEEAKENMRTLYFKAMRDAPGLHYVNLECIPGRPGFQTVSSVPLPPEPEAWTDH
jgi:replicative DNA helicase